MTERFDLRPSARTLEAIVSGIQDQQLDDLTPCEGVTVRAMLGHVDGLVQAFRDAALKIVPDGGTQAPEVADSPLEPHWRERIPGNLDELVVAWEKPDAWEGVAEAGGVTMPSRLMATVVVDEMVMHGWDLARATGQSFSPDPQSTAIVLAFCEAAAEPEQAELRNNIFGPIVKISAGAPDFERALGLAGRNPTWTP